MLGENHHVAPIHPEYAALPPLRRDVARAKELLTQADYQDGIDIELTVGNTQGHFEEETGRVLQKSLAEAGIRLTLNIIPADQYWPNWMKLVFGMTYWAHRPLGVTALDLGYRSGASWNETGFADWEFDKALDRALARVDPRQRAVEVETCEKILQDACIMVQPFWLDEMTVVAERVRNFRAHPIDYYDLREVWLV
jgi:peptide/nickel transport system substrate-binding protein